MNEKKANPGVPIISISGNSNKNKSSENNQRAPLQPVVSGTSIRKKRPLVKRFVETFLADDIKQAKHYVIEQVIVPTIKDTIFDSIMGSLEIMLFGRRVSSRFRSTSPQQNTTKINYNGYSTPTIANQQSTMVVDNRSKIDIFDVSVETKQDAERVIWSMLDRIRQYQSVTVGEFYTLCNQPSDFTDEDYGWYDLGQPKIVYMRGGRWGFDLPNPVDLRG